VVEETIECEVVVVGMGTCGEDASLRLSGAGVDVVGVEEHLIGGECPYWACLPSKSLIRSSNLVAEARRADGLIGSVAVEPDWSIVAERLRSEVTGGWEDSAGVTRFEARGGRFIRGRGHITAPGVVSVGGIDIRASLGVLMATGSSPLIPPIPGLDAVPYWTNHEAIAVEELPESLVVLGGGAVGCELGQMFSRFGVDVTIVEAQKRLLSVEEPEASTVVEGVFGDEGIELLTGRRATGVENGGSAFGLDLDDGSTVHGERILVAVGRTADAGAVGVANAGATVDRGFVEVDGRMRAADRLWAIGDVTGRGLLTEVALYQGLIAVEDILGASPPPADYSVIPRVVFTDPEVAAVGLTQQQARAQDRNVAVVVKDIEATFRGWLHRTGNAGVVKLVVDRDEDRLLGATVVGPRGADVIGILALAVQEKLPLDSLSRMIYGFPTFYGAVGEALGAYGRGLVGVLDPGVSPLFDDPRPGQTR
jgi:pyruvate/2-oxoglutarate dehydrogenase complex dihydrolipoamide dehydrogenase (E3) component